LLEKYEAKTYSLASKAKSTLIETVAEVLHHTLLIRSPAGDLTGDLTGEFGARATFLHEIEI